MSAMKAKTKTQRRAEAKKVYDEAIKPAQLIYNDSTNDAFRVIREAKQVLYDATCPHLDTLRATQDRIEVEMPRRISARQKLWQKSLDEKLARQNTEGR